MVASCRFYFSFWLPAFTPPRSHFSSQDSACGRRGHEDCTCFGSLTLAIGLELHRLYSQKGHTMTHTMLGLFNLGGDEIVLILILLSMLLIVPAALIGLIFLITRLTRKSSRTSRPCNRRSRPAGLRAALDAGSTHCLHLGRQCRGPERALVATPT